MRTGLGKQPPVSQGSYDYEKAGTASNVEKRRRSNNNGSFDRSASGVPDHHVVEDLFLLQDIAFDEPEIESSLVTAMSCVKQRNSFALPAWFFDVFLAVCHFLLVGVFVFLIGLITGFFMSSPTGFSGSYIWKTHCANVSVVQHQLFVIEDTADKDILHVDGTISISHYIHNPTPFAASLSSFVSVSYLPSSQLASSLDHEKCLNDGNWKAQYGTSQNKTQDGSDVLQTPIGDVFKKTGNVLTATSEHPSPPHPPPNVDSSNVNGSSEEGNLITLAYVDRHPESTHSELVHIVDSSMFDVFTSHLLLANKLHVMAEIDRSLNEVSYLITIKMKLSKTGENELMARQLVHDCERGHVLLRLESTEQRFETMFFGGDMLPRKFFPLRLPCHRTITDQSKKDLSDTLRNQREQFVNQYNILLNMDTMSSRKCPLHPPEPLSVPVEVTSS